VPAAAADDDDVDDDDVCSPERSTASFSRVKPLVVPASSRPTRGCLRYASCSLTHVFIGTHDQRQLTRRKGACYTVSQKNVIFVFPYLCQILTDFQNFSTGTLFKALV